MKPITYATYASGLIFLILTVVYISVSVSHKDKIQSLVNTYKPVSLVTNLYNVRQVGLHILEDGNRVLVPSGEYEGIWKVRDIDWVRDDVSVEGRRIYDLSTKRSLLFHGDHWTTICEDILGKDPRGRLSAEDGILSWNDFRWTQEGTKLVIQDPRDGAYEIVMEDGNVYALSIIDKNIYSELPTQGLQVCLKSTSRAIIKEIFSNR